VNDIYYQSTGDQIQIFDLELRTRVSQFGSGDKLRYLGWLSKHQVVTVTESTATFGFPLFQVDKSIEGDIIDCQGDASKKYYYLVSKTNATNIIQLWSKKTNISKIISDVTCVTFWNHDDSCYLITSKGSKIHIQDMSNMEIETISLYDVGM
jgi:hypothetical protein